MPPGGLCQGLRARGAGVRDHPVRREPHERVEQRGEGEDAPRPEGVRAQGAQDRVLPGVLLWILTWAVSGVRGGSAGFRGGRQTGCCCEEVT